MDINLLNANTGISTLIYNDIMWRLVSIFTADILSSINSLVKSDFAFVKDYLDAHLVAAAMNYLEIKKKNW